MDVSSFPSVPPAPDHHCYKTNAPPVYFSVASRVMGVIKFGYFYRLTHLQCTSKTTLWLNLVLPFSYTSSSNR